MKIECPKCKHEVDTTDINVAADIAHCKKCNEVFSLSELLNKDVIKSFDLTNPPSGSWFKRLPQGFQVGVSTKSFAAFFIIPFMVVWSGASLGGIYGSQIISGKFDPFMSFFGIPFLLGSVIFWAIGLMFIFGKVTVTVEQNNCTIFTGIGSIGWSRYCKWNEISSVYDYVSTTSRNNRSSTIVLEGKKRVSFGSLVKSERKYFMIQALRKML